MRKIYFILVALTIFVLAFRAFPADDALVGYWAFDEGEGGDVKDSSANGNDGIIKGNFNWEQGKVGNALVFSKAGKTYVEIPDSDSLDLADQLTISAWIKPSEIYVGNAWQERICIVAKKRAYYLDISEKGNLACYLYNVQPQQWFVSNTDMKEFIDKWVHVAVTYDGAEQRLYVDGKLDASIPKAGSVTQNGELLTIGYVDNNRYFDGLIDEVRIWSRALAEDELQGLLPVKPQDKLAARWGALKCE